MSIISNDSQMLERMISIQNEYFSKNNKNKLFKKSQKFDCAKYMIEKIDINLMISEAIYILPGTDIIFIDYVIFKIFANEDIYDRIIDHIIELFDYSIKYYGKIQINLNLRTFTISSAERYIPAIKLFCSSCLSHKTNYTEYMKAFVILNTPSVMEMIITIVKPFVEKDVISKLTFLNKNDTIQYCKDTNFIIKSEYIQK